MMDNPSTFFFTLILCNKSLAQLSEKATNQFHPFVPILWKSNASSSGNPSLKWDRGGRGGVEKKEKGKVRSLIRDFRDTGALSRRTFFKQ